MVKPGTLAKLTVLRETTESSAQPVESLVTVLLVTSAYLVLISTLPTPLKLPRPHTLALLATIAMKER